MYLKALELHGFKSFPIRTRLTFEKDITAIVGPNGSGKSNIADALRWVMGEQSSRTLRGGKMEDVIFGGTEKRGPMGFAEVTLVFDNSGHIFDRENEEVSITRRYYRSGDSEYYINKEQCRLRDISEMLMDTGMGREGYSIIGQGKIDEILSVRSTDRREIFEEAAGISRFRHRKEEAERKLEKADDNLLRINDKISELEMQVEPLRKQSETAKRYLVLRDELRGLEISVWMEELERIAGQNESLASDCRNVAEELTRAKEELEKLYASGEAYYEKVQAKEEENERVRGLLTDTEGVISRTESDKAVLATQRATALENIERLKAELTQQEGRNSGISAQIAEREARIREIGEKRERLGKEYDGTVEAITATDRKAGEAEKAVGEARLAVSNNAAMLSGERARVTALAQAMQEAEDRSTDRLGELTRLNARLEEAGAEAKRNEELLEKAREAQTEMENLVKGHTIRFESRKRRADEANQRKVNAVMELGTIRSRINLLAEMEKEYEGYSRAVKSVRQAADRGLLQHIHGTVAELIRSEGRYTLAIETALGGAIQDLVVDQEEDAKAGIEYLKKKDLGRATFRPLSAMRGNRLNERGLEDEDGMEGIASDLVTFDRKYEGVILNLLGRTVICENMTCAIRMARKYSHRFRIVTLDGQVINAGGSMTGGSASRNAGILSRANELEALREREKEAVCASRNAERAAQDAERELTAAQYELERANDGLHEAQSDVLRWETALSHSEILVEAVRHSRDDMQTEAGNAKEKAASAQREMETIRANIEALLEKADMLEREAQRLEENVRGMAEQRRQTAETLASLRAEDASLAAELTAVRRGVEELQTLREELSGGREQILVSIRDYENRSAELEQEILAREMELERLELEASGFRKRLSQITQEKLRMEAERTRRDKEIQEKNEAQIELERESAHLEQKLQAVQNEEKLIIDKLWDNYELSRTAAASLRQTLENKAEAQKRITSIRREISRLGPPNLGAIEEFERVNSRYTFLSEQRADIEKSRSELLKIIREITTQMKDIFSGEFKQIAEMFAQTFQELFGGGKAALELENEENILDCGIEIKVQPPGKTLKTITLLSGGEKAFVAIALYFAILKVRPSPFVLMDEIEAALDEANVTRYAQYMRNMADKTQFLVITHRRNTMEEADVLYGVTMQERGVSKVMSLDLREAEKTVKS